MSDDRPMTDPPPGRNYAARIRLAVIIGIVTLAAVVVMALLSPRGPLGRASQVKDVAASGREILNGCMMFAAENGDKFPPHLAALVARGMDTKFLVSPAGTPMTRPAGGADWRLLARDVDAHCDFTYTGAGVRSGDTPMIIALYSKAGVVPGGRVVGYIDGHVEFVKDADLPVIFEQNNTAREGARRPRIMLDASGNMMSLPINPA
jgi:hypothetical protein